MIANFMFINYRWDRYIQYMENIHKRQIHVHNYIMYEYQFLLLDWLCRPSIQRLIDGFTEASWANSMYSLDFNEADVALP